MRAGTCKPRGKPFVKGDPRANRNGRPPGALSIAKRTVMELAEAVVFDVEVQNAFIELGRQGKIPPGVYVELLHYAGGKPPATIRKEVSRSVDEERHAQAIRMLPQEKRYALANILLEVERQMAALPPAVIEVKAKRKKAGK